MRTHCLNVSIRLDGLVGTKSQVGDHFLLRVLRALHHCPVPSTTSVKETDHSISLRLYITSLPSQKAFRIIFSQCYTLRLFSSMRLEMLWLLLQSGNLFQYSEILYYFFIIPSLLFSFNGTLITKFK